MVTTWLKPAWLLQPKRIPHSHCWYIHQSEMSTVFTSTISPPKTFIAAPTRCKLPVTTTCRWLAWEKTDGKRWCPGAANNGSRPASTQCKASDTEDNTHELCILLARNRLSKSLKGTAPVSPVSCFQASWFSWQRFNFELTLVVKSNISKVEKRKIEILLWNP